MKKTRKTKRHGGRVVLALDMVPSAREALRQKAARAGVSMAEYLTNAIAEPERTYDTDAVAIGYPLVRTSYFIMRAIGALAANDLGGVEEHLQAARKVIADALAPLSVQHAEELRTRESQFGGWDGLGAA